MKPIKKLLPKIGLSLLSILIILLALEVVFRVKAQSELRRGIQVLSSAEKNVNFYKGKIQLRHILRLSNHPRIIYELIPNLSVSFLEKPLRTNPEGFRSPSYPKSKGAGTMRIVGLGDSFMFGWGVSNKECYLAALESKLESRDPALSWEVINTAVPGYNTVMEVETLRTKGLEFEPNIVIIHYVGNDIDLPNFIREQEDIWTLRDSSLRKFIFGRLHGNSDRIRDPLVPAPKHLLEERFENEPRRVPGEYKNMVGRVAFTRAMNELKDMSREHGFLLLVVLLQAPDYVRETCARLEIPLVETIQKINEIMEAQGIQDYLGSVLTISERDPHPSPMGHAVIAECIYEHLDRAAVVGPPMRRIESSGERRVGR